MARRNAPMKFVVPSALWLTIQNLLQGANRTDLRAQATRQCGVASLGTPMRSMPRRLLGAGQRRTEHGRIGSHGEGSDEAA